MDPHAETSAGKPLEFLEDTIENDEDEGEQAEILHNWEKQYDRSWEAIQEDDRGLLTVKLDRSLRASRRKKRDGRMVRRGILRYLVIVLDSSSAMQLTDIKPNRVSGASSALKEFIPEFFDQNPLSQIAVVVAKDSLAEKVTDLSGNSGSHVEAIEKLSPSGSFSLQNSLDVSLLLLDPCPKHSSREILFVLGAITMIDPANVFQSIERAESTGARVSVVGMGGEVHICSTIARRTRGTYRVAKDEPHLRSLIREHVTPLAIMQEKSSQRSTPATLIKMGFPRHRNFSAPVFAPNFERGVTAGYECPRCHALTPALPADCAVCSLALVPAPHLARSFHHLFPTLPYRDIDDVQGECFGCGSEFIATAIGAAPPIVTQCPRCNERFCGKCDEFIHDALHNCPGCCGLDANTEKADVE